MAEIVRYPKQIDQPGIFRYLGRRAARQLFLRQNGGPLPRTVCEYSAWLYFAYLQVDPPSVANRMGYGTIIRSSEGPGAFFGIETDTQLVSMTAPLLNEPNLHWLVREGQPLPEPSTLALLGLGVIALAGIQKKRLIT